MKKAIILVALMLMLTPVSFLKAAEDHEEGHICFRRIDANNDDLVDPAELAKFFPQHPSLLDEIDKDKDGKITHEEYEEYWFSQEG